MLFQVYYVFLHRYAFLDAAKIENYRMKSLSYLNKYFFKYKWHMLLGIIFMIISNYFGVQMPIFLKDTIDSLFQFTTPKSTSEIIWILIQIGGTYIFLSFMKGLFLFFLRQSIIKMSRYIEYDLKNEIYQQYQDLDYSFYKKNNTGDLMNRISEDVSNVRMYLGPGVMYTLNLVILFALYLTAMIKINSSLALYVLIPLPIMSFLIYKVSSKMNRLSKEVQEEQSKLSTIIKKHFRGYESLKLTLEKKKSNKD